MVLPIIAVAKLKLLSVSSPLLTGGLLCPFLLKLACSFRLARRSYCDGIYTSRLFIFQLNRIAFDGMSDRIQRVRRLVWQRLALARRSPEITQSDEDNFHALSVFSL
ncbi:hypothetical protein M5689_007778 [Euphorbia peplus]|nr:hypothetical protein M5689_007778 [Euphorbia peplus]